MGRTYSTGEAAELIGRTPTHCKSIAQKNGIRVPKQGARGDWVWQEEHIAKVKVLVVSGVSK